ncbi:arginine--tRNA ligase, partial [Proteus terrae]|uniref:arginine--tRNA ligase domain-containing protein n=1 Tax=Proteus terrae TaxID=1574161 RepID=UPI003315B290
LDITDVADKVEIAGPGFINIFLSPQWVAKQAEDALADEHLNVTLTEDDIMGESLYNPMLPGIVADLKAKGLAVESEGATVVF